MDRGTVRFDPRTERFSGWPSGNNMFGLDPTGNVWHTDDGGPLFKIDTTTGTVTEYKIPTNDGVYDMDTDSKGRTIINIWRNAKIGVFDPRSEAYAEYKTPTPDSGPRRGDIDARDRLWVAEYYSGLLAMFDPANGQIKEFPLVPGAKAYGPPYLAPYTATVDDKNQLVWATDFNSNRIFKFDMKTEKSTEFFMPGNYEVRDLTAEPSAPRPTLWIPSYRPPSKIVKVQIR
jgi:virginiamycin B lyase